ncbi:MAG: alpha-L-rhamnosidase N-terminal domain-containing protein [Acidobacteriota bacterium]
METSKPARISRRLFLLSAQWLMGRPLTLGWVLRHGGLFHRPSTNTGETANKELPAPAELLVNGVPAPLAIDKSDIRFSWLIPPAGRGQVQAAYRVLVASSPQLLGQGHGDLWDSGRVISAQSAAVVYQGHPLTVYSSYWWKVCIWDDRGGRTRYSEAATFEIGPPIAQWRASFIWDGATTVNHFIYLRKQFHLQAKPSRARAYVSAHNDYLLYLNGVPLGMGPARSDPFRFGQYNTYNITETLVEGTNVFAAVGHWLGTWNDSGVNARPAFILEGHIEFADGAEQKVLTDGTWKVAPRTAFLESSPTYFGAAGGSRNRAAIQYDARLEQDGWTELNFDDSAWLHATPVDCSDYKLHAQLVAPQAEQQDLRPIGIKHDGAAWSVDFGKCYDGWFQLVMHNNRPGDLVRVEYFQLDGRGGPSGWDQYTCKGGLETWRPNIGRHATFRTLRITGYAGELTPADVCAVWAYTSADVGGSFHCSSDLLNDIFFMSERSARQNVQQGIISVDANREQSPWLADSWNAGCVLLYNHKNTMVIDKIIQDYAAEQLSIGNFYACSPAAVYQIPEWSMYWPMLLWQQYLFFGDQRSLEDRYPNLVAFLNWIRQYQDKETGLINPVLRPRDWRISDYAGGSMPSGGYNIATNSQYYENLRIASKAAAVLGKTFEADDFRRQSEIVKQGINTHLFSGTHYYSRTDRNDHFALASAWALRFNLAPDDALDAVVNFIKTSGPVSIGGYGGDAWYSGALNSRKLGEYVVRDLVRYKAMLEGNDTNWETFDTGEYNHAWTCYPAYLFHKYICGIQPTGGGFSTFDIRPDVSGLAWARSEIPTVKGVLRTGWERTGSTSLVLTAEVPPNSLARIYMPKLQQQRTRIFEGNQLLWKEKKVARAEWIASAVETAEDIVLEVRSGLYKFTVT